MDFAKIETELGEITNKYNLPASPPKTANFRQLQDSPDTPGSFHPLQLHKSYSKKDPTVSRSIAGAMTALQEKWKNLELENQRLRENTISLEKKYFDDKEHWQAKILKEIDRTGQVEIRYEKNIREVNIELSKLRGTIAELEEENTLMKSQRMSLREIPKEPARDSHNFELLSSKIGDLHQDLESRNDDVASLEAAIRRTEMQRDEIFNELQESRIQASDLQDKVSGLESELITMENATAAIMDNQVAAEASQELNEENHQLKGENSKLKEINLNQRGQIELLKAQMEQLRSVAQLQEEAVVARQSTASNQPTLRQKSRSLKRIRTTSPPPKSTTSSTHDHGATWHRKICSINNDNKSSRGILKHSKSNSQRNISINLSRDKIKSKDNLTSLIAKLEKDLKRCNTNYKQLLSSSRGSNKDLSSLRIDLNRLAQEIEEKSGQVLKLKRQVNI